MAGKRMRWGPTHRLVMRMELDRGPLSDREIQEALSKCGVRRTLSTIQEVRGHPDYGMRLRSAVARRHQAAAVRALRVGGADTADSSTPGDDPPTI